MKPQVSDAISKSIGITARSKARQRRLEERSKSTPTMKNKLFDVDSYHLEEEPVMVTGASTVEEQIAALTKMVESLNKHIQEQDAEIIKLRHEKEKYEDDEEDDISETSEKHHEREKQHPKSFQVSSNGFIQIDQLKEFIEGTMKAKFDGNSKSSLSYSKPYTRRIDQLRMPNGYQPPKFQQFDGKGNLRQHVAHFIEICNNAGTYEDHLVKQFVRSLKGNAFDWYTDLESNTIDSWEQLEHEFLNGFYSTRRTVSMVELTSSLQFKEEPVIDYINRCRNLCLNCKDRLSESSTIEMCIQGM